MAQANRKAILVASTNIALIAVGVGGSAISYAFSIPGPRAWLAFSIAAIAVVTFFGLLQLRDERSVELGELRTPIAGTVIVIYVVLVTISSFHFVREEIPELTGIFITSFTSIVGVVVAFYFGSSAYIAASSRRVHKSKNGNPPSEETV